MFFLMFLRLRDVHSVCFTTKYNTNRQRSTAWNLSQQLPSVNSTVSSPMALWDRTWSVAWATHGKHHTKISGVHCHLTTSQQSQGLSWKYHQWYRPMLLLYCDVVLSHLSTYDCNAESVNQIGLKEPTNKSLRNAKFTRFFKQVPGFQGLK